MCCATPPGAQTRNSGDGNHNIVEQSISALTNGNLILLTPTGAGKNSNKSIAVIASGAAKINADVLYQNGQDIASWVVKGGYAVVNGEIRLLTSSITHDMPATLGAIGLQITPVVYVQNSAAEIIFGFDAVKGAASVSCSAKAEVVISR